MGLSRFLYWLDAVDYTICGIMLILPNNQKPFQRIQEVSEMIFADFVIWCLDSWVIALSALVIICLMVIIDSVRDIINI